METAPYRAWLACAEGCSDVLPLEASQTRCARCGGLLEVVHDLAALRATPADEWRRRFAARLGRLRGLDSSGVWSKQEWVAPGLRRENIVSLGEGRSPLVDAARHGASIGHEDLLVKQCGASPTGSFKDLGMTVLVSLVRQRIADGLPTRAIVCASTGDTSAALAAYAAAAGLRSVVLLPAGKITTAQLSQPLSHGALVLALDTDFDGCMAIVRRLAEEPGIYVANSMNAIRLEGQKTVALELAEQLDWTVPDWVVIPGGNLGNVSALAAGFDLLRALGLVGGAPRICVAQARAANPLYRAYCSGDRALAPMTAEATEASAIRIGQPVSWRRALRALERYDGVVEDASEAELAEAAAAADRTGLFACPQTGVALAALAKLVGRGVVARHHRVVVISTASALKFPEFKVRYHEGRITGVASLRPNRPVSLAPDYDAVRDAVLGPGGLP